MTIPTTSIEGVGLGPVADSAAFPPLDGLLAQNVRATADFNAAVEKFQLAMASMPLPVAEAPVEKAPVVEPPIEKAPVAETPVEKTSVAEAPIARAPVAEAPIARAPVAKSPVAKVPAEGAPYVDTTALPPLDSLLAQNVQVTADFKAAVEKFQLVMERLPLPVVETPVEKAPVVETPVKKALVAEVPIARAPVAEAPIARAPVAEAPIARAPVAEAPIARPPVAESPVAKVPAEGAPYVDTTALPPLDSLLAQNVQVTADFKAAVEKFQLAMASMPLPVAEAPAEKAPVAEALAEKAPVAEAPAEKAPVAEALVEKAPVAEAPVENAPVVETPVKKAPVAEAPIARVPVAESPVAKVPAEGAPYVDTTALPPLDSLLAQNVQVTADFKAAVEKFQLAMEALPSSKVMDTEETGDGVDVAAPQALPVVEVSLPVRTERVEAVDGAGVVRDVEGVRAVEAVGSKDLIVIAEAVADRVLVSQGLMQGDGEVRVLLKPDVLQGTEIRVVSENGAVTVNFIPATPEVAALLERNQPMLVQHLATHVPSVRLGVSVGRRGHEMQAG